MSPRKYCLYFQTGSQLSREYIRDFSPAVLAALPTQNKKERAQTHTALAHIHSKLDAFGSYV